MNKTYLNVYSGTRERNQSVSTSASPDEISKRPAIRSRLRRPSFRNEGKSTTSQPNQGGRKSSESKASTGSDSSSDEDDGKISVIVEPCSGRFWNQQRQKKDVYKMDHVPRGCALIVSNTKFNGRPPRKGGDVDLSNVTALFKGLSFETYILENITAKGIEDEILAFSKRQEHSQMDCCVVVLMSHGHRNVIAGTDNKPVRLEDIFTMFDNDKCPQLIGKPKLFFIQACRGGKVDKGVAVPEDDEDTLEPVFRNGLKSEMRSLLQITTEEDESDGPETKPTRTDMLFGYATQLDHKAFRDCTSGSWFIKTITEVFMNQAKDKHLLELMTTVMSEVSKRTASSSTKPEIRGGKEVAEFVSSLHKMLYFFPGAPFPIKHSSGSRSSKSLTKRLPSPQPSCSGTKSTSASKNIPRKTKRQHSTDRSNSSDEDSPVSSSKRQKKVKSAGKKKKGGGGVTDIRKCVDMVSKNVRSSWDDLARQLGFDHEEIEEIRDLRGDHRRRCIVVLDRWIDKHGDDATMEDLSEALVQTGKKDVADKLKKCQF
uniref:Caspase-8 n=1 Tax=Branchiostoma floridae TaxID=7739 RepID=C3YM60_BRAFL|eukprot:XP_002602642.1 hypothetical protein BRAFLDRAFT_81923 [Branchiostoma floridae]